MKFQLFLTSLLPQTKGRHWWLAILVWLALVAPAQAGVILRVAIERGVDQVKVGSSTPATVKDSSGRNLGQLPGMSAYYAQANSGGVALDQWQAGAFWIEPTNAGLVYIGDRWYRGKTLVIPTEKGLTAVNYVDVEEYLPSVIGGEMDGSWPQEALKAQAVAARTYALYKRENERNPIYDVGDTPFWQIYKGVISESSTTQAAVNATRGQVLTYNNQLILSVFHACSGGHTENVEEVWMEPLPYLRGVQDFDQNVRQCNWQKTLSRGELNSKISGVGNIESIVPATTTTYGSIKTMKVIGDQGTKVVKGDTLRNTLGLKSTRFKIVNGGNAGFVVVGRGFGHGLGMSQWGAHTLARQGVNYLQILGHYYRGAALSRLEVR
jgi:stage II sporulation protein D